MSAAITGAAYVDAMNRDPTDREYRRAFQDLALTLVPLGGRVFDFGCGPGLDAKRYAREGRHVTAYDVDAAMCEYFSAHCASEIESGSVKLDTGAFADFLRVTRTEPGEHVDLIVANFAPLNLIADLTPLIARFASMLKPRGRLLASVLNPLFHELPRSRAWWRALPRLLWTGSYMKRLHGEIPVYRWFPGYLAARAAPHFDPICIHAPDTRSRSLPPRRVRLTVPTDWPHIVATQFLFLELRRGPT